MKELFPATHGSPKFIKCDDGRTRVKEVCVRTLHNPDGTKDYHTFWAYRLPKRRNDIIAARKLPEYEL